MEINFINVEIKKRKWTIGKEEEKEVEGKIKPDFGAVGLLR